MPDKAFSSLILAKLDTAMKLRVQQKLLTAEGVRKNSEANVAWQAFMQAMNEAIDGECAG